MLSEIAERNMSLKISEGGETKYSELKAYELQRLAIKACLEESAPDALAVNLAATLAGLKDEKYVKQVASLTPCRKNEIAESAKSAKFIDTLKALSAK